MVSGGDCSIDIDDCQLDPCQNDATCIDLLDDYFCDCPAGESTLSRDLFLLLFTLSRDLFLLLSTLSLVGYSVHILR